MHGRQARRQQLHRLQNVCRRCCRQLHHVRRVAAEHLPRQQAKAVHAAGRDLMYSSCRRRDIVGATRCTPPGVISAPLAFHHLVERHLGDNDSVHLQLVPLRQKAARCATMAAAAAAAHGRHNRAGCDDRWPASRCVRRRQPAHAGHARRSRRRFSSK